MFTGDASVVVPPNVDVQKTVAVPATVVDTSADDGDKDVDDTTAGDDAAFHT